MCGTAELVYKIVDKKSHSDFQNLRDSKLITFNFIAYGMDCQQCRSIGKIEIYRTRAHAMIAHFITQLTHLLNGEKIPKVIIHKGKGGK